MRVWDLESRTSVHVIRGHTDTLSHVAFSPDGDRLVTGSKDGTARVWDLTFDHETGASEFGPIHHHEAIEAIAYARGGRELRIFARIGRVYRLAAGSLGRLRDISTGLRVGWRTPFEPAAFDAEGRRVIAVDHCSVREAVCQDVDGGGRRTTLRGHTMAIAFATSRPTAPAPPPRRCPGSRSRAARSSSGTLPPGACSIGAKSRASGSIASPSIRPAGGWPSPPSGSSRRLTGPGTRAAPFVAVVDVETGRELLAPRARRRSIPGPGLQRRRPRLAAAGINRTVLIWDLAAGTDALQSQQGPPGNAWTWPSVRTGAGWQSPRGSRSS